MLNFNSMASFVRTKSAVLDHGAQILAIRNAGVPEVWIIYADGHKGPLHHIARHSPDGFEWGYGGSGPADLAFSILTRVLGDEDHAERLYQDFKWEIIARAGKIGFSLGFEEIRNWAKSKEEK